MGPAQASRLRLFKNRSRRHNRLRFRLGLGLGLRLGPWLLRNRDYLLVRRCGLFNYDRGVTTCLDLLGCCFLFGLFRFRFGNRRCRRDGFYSFCLGLLLPLDSDLLQIHLLRCLNGGDVLTFAEPFVDSRRQAGFYHGHVVLYVETLILTFRDNRRTLDTKFFG